MIFPIHWLVPPGHHATADRAMGFCLINNLAVALEYMRKHMGFKNSIILDFDAHYGNGTAEIFYQDPQVLYISIHQDPHTIFPGKGFIEEIGNGDGKGLNLNIPMPPGSRTSDYIYILEKILETSLQLNSRQISHFWMLGLTDTRKIPYPASV